MSHIFKLCLILFLSFSAQAVESIKTDHIQVSFVLPEQFGPGANTVGIRYVMDKNWHVYWKNPGDSGSAPKFEFTTENSQLGPILWPTPHRIPFSDLVNFGYENSVILPFEMTPQAGSANVRLNAKLEWLVCNEGECIPGFATLEMQRPVGLEEKWTDKNRIELQNFLARTPQSEANSHWKITNATQTKDSLTVTVSGEGNFDEVDLFPLDGLVLKPQAPLKKKNDKKIEFIFQLQPNQGVFKSTGFVLSEKDKSWQWDSVEVGFQAFQASSIEISSLLILLISSFIGGVILNFMPCVLPVLSIKFFSISQTPPAQRMKESLLYTAGVLSTFSALGIAFLTLRSAGASVGWGFQLQSPIVVFLLVILFWLMSLNFLGVFEFGTQIMNAAGKSSARGAFGTGVLSVFVAAPCTGPFMGTALGAAATLPILESLAIFIFLGLGLASPFVLVAVSPQARKLIPKPGAWMEKLKEFFAFPLIATVIWLLWVLHLQIGVDALPLSLGALMILSFAFWSAKAFPKFKIGIGIFAILTILYAGYSLNSKMQENAQVTATNSLWKTFSPTAVQEARAQSKAVFIDFTAAWCITCQVNKKTVLRTAATQKLFQEKDVMLFEADWTKQDPVITKALAEFGRNSVPVYVYYAPDAKEAQILPQILTPSDIEGLF